MSTSYHSGSQLCHQLSLCLCVCVSLSLSISVSLPLYLTHTHTQFSVIEPIEKVSYCSLIWGLVYLCSSQRRQDSKIIFEELSVKRATKHWLLPVPVLEIQRLLNWQGTPVSTLKACASFNFSKHISYLPHLSVPMRQKPWEQLKRQKRKHGSMRVCHAII